MPKTTLPSGWKTVELRNIATPITEKAGGRKLETLSISAGIGFVNQAKKFGKELSGKQYVNYSVLRIGDFSFNKGNSRKYPYGCTYMLRDREIAAVPNAFYSFRIDNQCGDYYEQLFMLGYLNRQLKKLINTGVRDDGLFNLYEKDFYNFGAFKRLSRYDSGVVSPLYICFAASKNNDSPEFYDHFFESRLLDREIKAFAQEGARNHGLLNIAINDFFNMKIPLPPLSDQVAIAEILTTADKELELLTKRLEQQKLIKKYLMQTLLTGRIRVKGWRNEKSSDWRYSNENQADYA